MDNKSIGELIRKKRKEKNLTQEQLAKLLYVSSNAISKWELGKNAVDLNNLKILSDVLDIPLSQLLGNQPETSEPEISQTDDSVPAESESIPPAKEKKAHRKKIPILFWVSGAFLITAASIICFLWLGSRHSFTIREEHFNTYNGRDACYLIAECSGKLTAEIYDEYSYAIREMYTDYFSQVDVIVILYYPDYNRDQISSPDTADAITVGFPLITTSYTGERSCGESCRDHNQPDAAALPATRQATYRGNITPSAQTLWQETAAGVKYSGTLTLLTYTYSKKDNITTATYEGFLTCDRSQ